MIVGIGVRLAKLFGCACPKLKVGKDVHNTFVYVVTLQNSTIILNDRNMFVYIFCFSTIFNHIIIKFISNLYVSAVPSPKKNKPGFLYI